ncbi:unnamed protein product [Cyclocybe aegerita]|uniref:Uncharacterized protein n=1 Tax=Cyclocybe aegerita TaxID=1973307 RepID=A0A8S0W480_CYCAE|nr:unnamed protein product [Cyclocybe aegerita]
MTVHIDQRNFCYYQAAISPSDDFVRSMDDGGPTTDPEIQDKHEDTTLVPPPNIPIQRPSSTTITHGPSDTPSSTCSFPFSPSTWPFDNGQFESDMASAKREFRKMKRVFKRDDRANFNHPSGHLEENDDGDWGGVPSHGARISEGKGVSKKRQRDKPYRPSSSPSPSTLPAFSEDSSHAIDRGALL